MTAADRLVGRWTLVSYREEDGNGGWRDALGAGAEGVIRYGADGHMSVLIVGAGRPRFRGAWDAIPPQDKAAALDGLVAYAGAYEVSGAEVHHMVELCWIPNWQGRTLVRAMRFPDDDTLVLSTVSAAVAQEVNWRRAR